MGVCSFTVLKKIKSSGNHNKPSKGTRDLERESEEYVFNKPDSPPTKGVF